MTTRTNSSKTILFGVGIVTAIVALTAGVGGGALLWAHSTQRDDAGRYSTSTRTFQTDKVAIVLDDVDLGDEPAAADRLPGILGDVELQMTATSTAGNPVFVGIGRREDVDAYLARSAHDRIEDVEFSPFRVDSRPVPGAVRPAPPAQQTFWAASATGDGPQAATWSLDEGRWAVVIMNADASDGVAVDVSVAAKTGLLLWVGLGLTIFAGVSLLGSAMAFRRASVGTAQPPRPPAPAMELEGVR